MAMSGGGNRASAVVNGKVAEVVVERKEREEREMSCKNREEEVCSQAHI